MELRDLRYFVVLAEELHYRRAAKRLFITPSSLSKAVSRLEGSLGAQLVERSPREVSLTKIGTQIARAASEIVVAVENLRELAAGSRTDTTLETE